MAPRILVVDDEPALRVLVGRALRREGYEVVETEDGLDAWELARRAPLPFDLVVTNSRMPGLSGPELAVCLRELDPELPIVHVSGSHGSRAGYAGLPSDIPTLFKPFNLRDLVQEVRSLLAERETKI